ncbi:MAG: class I SAM-dependent methyltransferase [Leptolyngbyaceae cyanobacterium HOT.MB2.61]|nr:class I SAM-dependent methyltransferase [Leptolyngbyaceae cyanobacterium HOT.MB2.61]
MNNPISEGLEKIRLQFDRAPYPGYPIDQSPEGNTSLLFIHNLITPFYLRNQQILDVSKATILDAGCGNGYTSLALAIANPGAKIVGVDLSNTSIQMARQRMQHFGVSNAEFHTLSIEQVPSLGMEFDYINCDEVLYLVPNLNLALRSLQSVLKPKGILRGNLHSLYQRGSFFRAQQLFKLMGLMDSNPGETEVAIALQTIQALKDDVPLKSQTWNSEFEGAVAYGKTVTNYLLQGDKGFTIPDLFAALKTADLEFISMVNWQLWDLMELFKDPNHLPPFWQTNLPNLPIETRLHMFELMYPAHRLLDFWCGHPGQANSFIPPQQWQPVDWQNAIVHLHPQLRTATVREDLIHCIQQRSPFSISRYLSALTLKPVRLPPLIAACLLPLWEGAQPVMALVERLLKIKPLHPVTLEPMTAEMALSEIIKTLTSLEAFLYVLLEMKATGSGVK